MIITGEGSNYNIQKYKVRQKWYHFEYSIVPDLDNFGITMEDNKGIN